MNVPDLRSPQSKSCRTRKLAQVIANGKGGMPHSRIRSARIRSLDGFLRSLAASKEIGRTLYTAVVATGNGFSSFGREAVEKGGRHE